MTYMCKIEGKLMFVLKFALFPWNFAIIYKNPAKLNCPFKHLFK